MLNDDWEVEIRSYYKRYINVIIKDHLGLCEIFASLSKFSYGKMAEMAVRMLGRDWIWPSWMTLGVTCSIYVNFRD